MERKIGEIFEHNGEWYQCVEGNCAYCSIEDEACEQRIINDVCKLNRIFKKLEKVGEPTIINGKKVQLLKSKYCKNCDFWDNNDCTFTTYPRTCMGGEYGVYVEIKQNKEDMKENHKAEDTLLTRLVGRYVNNLIDYETFEKAVRELYSDKEESKPVLKGFDLEAAKAGKPVCTRDGRKARIICFDRVTNSTNEYTGSLVVLITNPNGDEQSWYYTNNGVLAGKDEYDNHKYDLMMLPEKKEGWINIYNADTTFYYVDGRVFETKDEAVQEAKEEVEKEQREKNEYIDTIRVEWEE